MAAAVGSLIRALKPVYSSSDDKLAYAVHACILSEGYRLVAVGEDAEKTLEAASSRDLPDVDENGWQVGEGVATLYQDAESNRGALLLKISFVRQPGGDQAVLGWARASDTRSGGQAPVARPGSLTLPVSRYAPDASPAQPVNLGELAGTLRAVIVEGRGSTPEHAVPGDPDAPPAGRVASRGSAGSPASQGPSSPERRPLAPWEGPGPACYDGARSAPRAVGSSDLAPAPGLRAPGDPGTGPFLATGGSPVNPGLGGVGRIGGIGGGIYGGSPTRPRGGVGGYDDVPYGAPRGGPARGLFVGGGGGSLVGPDHPIFSGRTPGGGGGGPRFDPSGAPSVTLPPGARFDPIGPPGTRGAHPDDFVVSGRRGIHPDVMQPGRNDFGGPPGPGAGGNGLGGGFGDSMFG